VPFVVLTAFFAGGLMMLQTGPFVKKLGATSLAGWGAGYAVLREIGPILIALMFSGRVGANNTAELSTMTVTEQLDGLRALAIDPVRFLVVPRVIAMIVTLVADAIGDLVADRRGGRARDAQHLVDDVPLDQLRPRHLHGVSSRRVRRAIDGATSGHRAGGAVGVDAQSATVVAAAVSIMLRDFTITYGWADDRRLGRAVGAAPSTASVPRSSCGAQVSPLGGSSASRPAAAHRTRGESPSAPVWWPPDCAGRTPGSR
jgi:phospholipid/cholesterol/gamma-HCH transport system permease protein